MRSPTIICIELRTASITNADCLIYRIMMNCLIYRIMMNCRGLRNPIMDMLRLALTAAVGAGVPSIAGATAITAGCAITAGLGLGRARVPA